MSTALWMLGIAAHPPPHYAAMEACDTLRTLECSGEHGQEVKQGGVSWPTHVPSSPVQAFAHM